MPLQNEDITQDDVQEPQDLRSTIASAMEKYETPSNEDNTPHQESTQEVEQVEVEGVSEEETVVEEGEKQESENRPEEATKVEAPATVKAPQSWKPATREKFAGLDKEVQAEIHRREVEISNKLKETAQERHFAKEIQEVLSPFAADIQTSGIPVKAIIGDLMSTAHVLKRGTTNEKVNVISNIIKNYGIDLVALDNALAGTVPQQQPGVTPEIQKRLDQLEAQERARLQQAQQQTERQLLGEVEKFAKDPKNEFFNDVVPLMKNYLESGVATSLDEAYEKAVWANPDTRKVMLERQLNKDKKQKAAQSLTSTAPRVKNDGKKPQFNSTREAIEYAVNLHIGDGKNRV